MKSPSIKLYRGLKTTEFHFYSLANQKQARASWTKILERRARGDFKFPQELAPEILRLTKLTRLERQHFTDDAVIAARYAKHQGGVLLEIEVGIGDLLKEFTLEFQNFGKRNKKFEIVYVVDATRLRRQARKWKMTMKSFD